MNLTRETLCKRDSQSSETELRAEGIPNDLGLFLPPTPLSLCFTRTLESPPRISPAPHGTIHPILTRKYNYWRLSRFHCVPNAWLVRRRVYTASRIQNGGEQRCSVWFRIVPAEIDAHCRVEYSSASSIRTSNSHFIIPRKITDATSFRQENPIHFLNHFTLIKSEIRGNNDWI